MKQEEKVRNLTETIGKEPELSYVRKIVAEHRWIFAKTYAAFCPHEYTLRKDWENDDEYRKLITFVWRYGVEAYFGKKSEPNRYWFDHKNGYYYFIFPEDTDDEGNATEEAYLVNRAKITDFDFWKDEKGGVIRCGRKRGVMTNGQSV